MANERPTSTPWPKWIAQIHAGELRLAALVEERRRWKERQTAQAVREGYLVAAIAEECDVTVKTVYRWLTNARAGR